MTSFVTVGGIVIPRNYNLFSVPALRDVGDGQLERCTLVVHAINGLLCNAKTERPLEANECESGLVGWGELDCEQVYLVSKSIRVPKLILDDLAKLLESSLSPVATV